MAADAYEVEAFIPAASDFSPRVAVAHYRSLGLRADEAAGADPGAIGFRVKYGDWAVVARLDESAEVRNDLRELLAPDMPRPTWPADAVAACDRRLYVRSDPDPDGDHSDHFTDFYEQLQARFGAYLYDLVDGEWWD